MFAWWRKRERDDDFDDSDESDDDDFDDSDEDDELDDEDEDEADEDDAASAVVGALARDGQLVRLRCHVPANRPAFQRWYADDEIARLLRHDQQPLTERQSRGYFDTLILPLSARGQCFAIHERASDRLIGTTAITDFTTRRGGARSALFRIVIGEKETWNRGYGTEATRLAMAEAFERLGLDEVRLEVFRHNPRALRAYERVGFRVLGEHVEHVGRPRMELQVIEMALSRQAFEALNAPDEAEPSPDITPG
ncbi:MAG TPA: GNAT family protein [Thermomicrobiales bacterium]|nr:GNAT family protein [Thermomicrobiales bacterium]